MVEKIQKEPNQKIYGELLIWVNLQQNNFYGAFIQAKAIDKKNNGQGRRVMDIGKIALENKSYDDAIEIYTTIKTKYPKTDKGFQADKYINRLKVQP